MQGANNRGNWGKAEGYGRALYLLLRFFSPRSSNFSSQGVNLIVRVANPELSVQLTAVILIISFELRGS